MSLSAMIRAAAGGSRKTRAEGDKPEEEMEDDVPVTDDDESAEGDQPEEDTDAEEDQPDDEAADDDENQPAAAADRKAYAAGRRAERRRVAAIMGNPAADANPALAAHLAFATSMNARDAREALKASSPTSGKLAGKMAGAGQPRLGGSAASGSPTPGDRLVALASTRFARGKAK